MGVSDIANNNWHYTYILSCHRLGWRWKIFIEQNICPDDNITIILCMRNLTIIFNNIHNILTKQNKWLPFFYLFLKSFSIFSLPPCLDLSYNYDPFPPGRKSYSHLRLFVNKPNTEVFYYIKEDERSLYIDRRCYTVHRRQRGRQDVICGGPETI